MKIHTSIKINGTPQQVWQVLTDFDAYPTWNPFVQSLTGNVKQGERITVKLPGMTFKPVILVFKENDQLTWLGHLLFKGLFDGEHTFKLEDNGDGTTTFHQSEKFKGLLVGFLKKMLLRDTLPGFKNMNQKLKERVENQTWN
ncbi:SRPBCC family protein [Owenweeksia hongkongensis]|uniref:SRPBCC family protein n=1 Tax=Owenweeksia hongkongensis TaxID=253245 RepID=UPI003A906BD5